MNQPKIPPKEISQVVPTTTAKESSNTTVINDTEEGVSFEIPKDWTKIAQPESGYPSYVSPQYSYLAMKLKGAFIAYNLNTPPSPNEQKSEEYLTFLKENYGWQGNTDWKTIVINGYSLLRQDMPENLLNKKTQIIGRVGNQFIDISFFDATNSYSDVFDAFLSSLKIN